MPRRERYLFVCTNERAADDPKGSCAAKGSRELHDHLKALTVTHGLRKRVRVCASSCLDLCWVGASIAVMPDRVFYGNVTRDDLPEIVDSLAKGTIVERLVVPDELFEDPARKKA